MKTDRQLKDDIETELRWEPSVHDEQIGVAVKDRVVQLSGEVSTYAEKWAAEHAVQRVDDVKAVALEIKVVVCPADSCTDEDLARLALEHLEWNSLLPKGLKVQVGDGWITLTGEVAWQYQREAAERTVRCLNGVRGVNNEIELRTPLHQVRPLVTGG